MPNEESIRATKDFLIKNNLKSFAEAVEIAKNPTSLILSILYALGYNDPTHICVENNIKFYSDAKDEILLVEFSLIKKTLSGKLKDDAIKAFTVINSIENELTSAIMYPISLRKKAIENVCLRAGVDLDFFERVLNNWK